MDDVFARLMDSAGVPEEKRPETLSALRSLRARYPNETPARLFARAQKQGAPIPPSRCNHGVTRGECVVCNPKIGQRWYFTAGGTHVHSTPLCPALTRGQDRVEQRGGNTAPIEVVTVYSGVADVRDPCAECAQPTATASPTPMRRSRPRPAPPPRPSHLRLQRATHEPRDLTPTSPPAAGDRIDWGGFSGVVTNVTERGVAFSVDGVTLTAPWGERATVHKPTP